MGHDSFKSKKAMVRSRDAWRERPPPPHVKGAGVAAREGGIVRGSGLPEGAPACEVEEQRVARELMRKMRAQRAQRAHKAVTFQHRAGERRRAFCTYLMELARAGTYTADGRWLPPDGASGEDECA